MDSMIKEAQREKKETDTEIITATQTLQDKADQMAQQLAEVDHLNKERIE